jgi:cysteine desulfurase
LDRQAIAMALDLEGVACSTGSACASGSAEPSPVLTAMGLSYQLIEGAIRFSLGADTTDVEIDRAAGRICKVVKNLDR